MALYGNYVGNGSHSSLKVVAPDYMSSGNKLKNSFKMETFWVSTLKTNKPPAVKDERDILLQYFFHLLILIWVYFISSS